MKSIILFVIPCLLAANSIAQPSKYVNITGGNPKPNKLYLKKSNTLVLKAGNTATGASTNNGWVLLRGDTLMLCPEKNGPVEVTITTVNGKEKLRFETVDFPEFQFVLDSHPPSKILLSKFMEGQKFILESNPPNDFFTGYFIESFSATIGESTIKNIGAMPGAKLVEAIKKAPVGSILYLTGYMLVNMKYGQRRTFTSNQQFLFNIE